MLPRVPYLIDGVRYFKPEDLPAPVGEELRPMMATTDPPANADTPRAVTADVGRNGVAMRERRTTRPETEAAIRSVTRQRRGIKIGPDRAAEAELERLLAE